MTDLTPSITDAERADARRRIRELGIAESVSCAVFEGMVKALVVALREPAWVPPYGTATGGMTFTTSFPGGAGGPGGGGSFTAKRKEPPHPKWLLDEAQAFINNNFLGSWADLLATALMTPPPKPPVDDATLCWRDLMAARSGKNTAEEYLAGDLDHQLTTATRQLLEHTLNWAKNREKQDD